MALETRLLGTSSLLADRTAMRALITGATGFVGGHLAEHLIALGDVLVGLSNAQEWQPALAHLQDSVPLEVLDLADPEIVPSLVDLLVRERPAAIYHLAAQANPSASLTDPRGTWALNLGGTLTLLEAVRIAGLEPRPRLLLVGSGVSYGNPKPEHLPVDESCPLRPNNPYSASKAAADLLGIQHFLSHGTATLMARPFNHSGPRQADVYVLGSFARQVVEIELGSRDRIEVGNLNVTRDFTDVRDIVRAYRMLITHGQPGEIYNIGSGRDVSLDSMLEVLRSLARVPIEIHVDPSRLRPVDQPLLLADSSKLRSHTGWQPLLSLEQTLSDMLADWRSRLST